MAEQQQQTPVVRLPDWYLYRGRYIPAAELVAFEVDRGAGPMYCDAEGVLHDPAAWVLVPWDKAEDYDLAAYQKADPLGRLRIIWEHHKQTRDPHARTFYEGQMFALSIDLDAHPEWFDNGCCCSECQASW